MAFTNLPGIGAWPRRRVGVPGQQRVCVADDRGLATAASMPIMAASIVGRVRHTACSVST
jgi:hypothetical protein